MRKLVESAFQRTKEILKENKSSLIKVAGLLLEKETIFKEDLEAILGKRPGDVPKAPLFQEEHISLAATEKEITALSNIKI